MFGQSQRQVFGQSEQQVYGQSERQSANGGKLKQECVTALSSVTSPVTSRFEINIVANICEILLPIFVTTSVEMFLAMCGCCNISVAWSGNAVAATMMKMARTMMKRMTMTMMQMRMSMMALTRFALPPPT